MKGGLQPLKKMIFAQLAVASFFWQPQFWKDLQASLSNSVDVTQQVTGTSCDRDSRCEKNAGENILNCPEDCQPSSFSKGGDRAIINNPLTIWGVKVEGVTENSARIEWNTDYDGICELQWGVTSEFENVVAETAQAKYHAAALEGLMPGTTYRFKLACSSQVNTQVTDEMKFATLEGADMMAPENVTGLGATYNAEESKIVLRWKNPQVDFSGAVILRNDKYFPRDQMDGYPVCQGSMNQCVDASVDPGEKYYYSVFVYDAAGNYSSGVGVAVVTGEGKSDSGTGQIPVAETQKLTIGDFRFYQEGSELKKDNGGRIVAQANERIEVLTDYDKFAKNCKSAYLVIGKDSNTQTYIFKASNDRAAYVSDIVLSEPEIYSFTIFVTTFSGAVYQIDGKILLEGGVVEIGRDFTENVMDEAIPDFLLLIILTLIIELILRRKNKKKLRKNNLRRGEDEDEVYL